MRSNPVIRSLALIAVLSLPACMGDAYVRPPGGMEREDPDFGKTSAEVGTVVICYSEFQTGRTELDKMANAECAKGGMVARQLEEEDYSTCPLMTPVATRYQCVAPSAVGSGLR